MNTEFDTLDGVEITQSAIPSALLVKQRILDARDAMIQAQENVNIRRRRGRPYTSQLNDYQASVERLYSYLREKLDGEKIRKGEKNIKDVLDNSIATGGKLGFKQLYKFACDLKDKIEELKITKIERKDINENEVF